MGKFKKVIKRMVNYLFWGIPQKTIIANIKYLQAGERLKGKKVVVTGGTRGIGLAIAKKMASEGAEVVITGRKNVTNDIPECLRYIQFDITNFLEMDLFWDKVEKEIGEIDILVNNAGISLHEKNILDVTLQNFDRQFDTNVKGAYFMSQSFIKRFIKSGKTVGNILFVSSERGTFVDDLPYGMTKAALNSLIQGLAYRYINNGIYVNAVAPGITATDLVGRTVNDNLYHKGQPNERVYLPEEMAEVACFLVSDVSKSLTGQIIVCNEGKSINSYYSNIPISF